MGETAHTEPNASGGFLDGQGQVAVGHDLGYPTAGVRGVYFAPEAHAAYEALGFDPSPVSQDGWPAPS